MPTEQCNATPAIVLIAQSFDSSGAPAAAGRARVVLRYCRAYRIESIASDRPVDQSGGVQS